jgi:hypothetical protein
LECDVFDFVDREECDILCFFASECDVAPVSESFVYSFVYYMSVPGVADGCHGAAWFPVCLVFYSGGGKGTYSLVIGSLDLLLDN